MSLFRIGLCLTVASAAAFGLASRLPAQADAGHGSLSGRPGESADVSRTIEIVATDSEYSHDSIMVEEGETVRFVVKNEGELLHEFTIGTKAIHRDHQEEMLEMMQEGKLDAFGMKVPMQHDHANSIILNPGETKSLVWMFPSGGDLEFACNVPGHYQAGMRGRIELESTS